MNGISGPFTGIMVALAITIVRKRDPKYKGKSILHYNTFFIPCFSKLKV